MARAEVGHVAGPELGVGAAHPGPVDVDDDLAVGRDRVGDFVHRPLARGGDDECSHWFIIPIKREEAE
jgi:hypothetical protein